MSPAAFMAGQFAAKVVSGYPVPSLILAMANALPAAATADQFTVPS